MKLWLLRPVDGLPDGDNPWEPWYDKSFGFVVRCESEKEAREIAHENAGDENRGRFLDREIARTTSPWLDTKYSTCVELTAEGAPGLVINDFAAA
jgi:hypothetical protein